MEDASQGKPTGRQMAFRLVILGDGSVRTIPLVGERWVIGRSPDCEITLRDPTVSRRHILLERHADTFLLKDLGGRNPVLVDGRPRAEAELTAGQTVAIGMTRLVFESRQRPRPVESSSETVVITGREVIDDELADEDENSAATRAQRILERIEWTFADLGSLSDAAEPLLAMALNLTGRQVGLLSQFLSTGGMETLATLDSIEPSRRFVVPDAVLREARRLNQVTLLSTSVGADQRLVIPLGDAPEGILVLDEPAAGAPRGQSVLRLARSIGQVIWHRLLEVRERLRLRDEVERLRFHGSAAHNAVLTSTRLHGARQTLRELANDDTAVLLCGEEGTEREDLARYLHAEGRRRRHPFVSLHLDLLTGWRAEKELFGSEGSSAPGAIAKARGGTLFLNDVTCLESNLQDRLLQVLGSQLQGAGDLPPTRLVASAATPPDPESDAWSGGLAEEFGSHQVTIPPLRDEPQDIQALVELILSDMGAAPDGSPRLVSERARRILISYPWPGNVRQLRLVLETAAAQAGSQQITPKHLPKFVTEPATDATEPAVPSLEEVERLHIRAVLRQFGGNKARTAQTLRIANSTLYDKLRRFGID